MPFLMCGSEFDWAVKSGFRKLFSTLYVPKYILQPVVGAEFWILRKSKKKKDDQSF